MAWRREYCRIHQQLLVYPAIFPPPSQPALWFSFHLRHERTIFTNNCRCKLQCSRRRSNRPCSTKERPAPTIVGESCHAPATGQTGPTARKQLPTPTIVGINCNAPAAGQTCPAAKERPTPTIVGVHRNAPAAKLTKLAAFLPHQSVPVCCLPEEEPAVAEP